MPPIASQPTIAILQVQQILQGVRDRGLELAPILRRAGIAPALLEAPLSRVTQAQYAALIRVLRRVTRDELWGIANHPLKLGSFAQACRLLIHCSTLGEALRAGAQFYHLLLEDFVPRLVVEQDKASLRLVANPAKASPLGYAELAFCFLSYGLISWLVARRIPVRELMYRPKDRGRSTDAERIFLAPVVYAYPWVGYSFDARWLDLPIVQTPQSLQEFLQQAPSSMLVKYRDQTNLAERIRRLLRRHLAEEMPSLEKVSQALALTPQTLRRRLRDEGQGFQSIKDNLRRDAAIEYLAQPELTLLDIANRLGFSEASTFHRAFKGWTGQAPGIYRQAYLTKSAG
ncbi:MAG: AraC family transcriptional regulator [Acidovorax sp.]|jgi:AraC-like DNA-binding protein|nr:AraC family transcriptional regulator [Acidovorax sp.]